MRSSIKFLQLLKKNSPFFSPIKFSFARNLKMKQFEPENLLNNPTEKIKEQEDSKPKPSLQIKPSSIHKLETKTKPLKDINSKNAHFESKGKNFEKDKKKEQKTRTKEPIGNFSKKNENESMENLLKNFNETKTNFDVVLYLKFLNSIIKNKKTHIITSQMDIDIKRNLYKEILPIPEVKECISTLKSHIVEMGAQEITNFLSLLSKIDYYDEEIISYISNRIIKKEIVLNSLAISYLIWSLAKYRIKNKELLEVLVQSLLTQPSVIFL